jgi:hypothetical protein
MKRKQDMETKAVMDMTSKLNLIDLAGSENAGTAGKSHKFYGLYSITSRLPSTYTQGRLESA